MEIRCYEEGNWKTNAMTAKTSLLIEELRYHFAMIQLVLVKSYDWIRYPDGDEETKGMESRFCPYVVIETFNSMISRFSVADYGQTNCNYISPQRQCKKK